MTTQTEAQKLADWLDAHSNSDYSKGVDAAAELRRLEAANAELLVALINLLDRDQRNTCQHERTHRGGAIWEICDDCGAKWADDRGGRPDWVDPAEWVLARAAIAKHRGAT